MVLKYVCLFEEGLIFGLVLKQTLAELTTKYSFFNDFGLVFGHFVYLSTIYVIHSFYTRPISIINKEHFWLKLLTY